MEGKTPVSVFVAVLLLICLILEQTHVEATTNCPSTTSRNCYNTCRFPGNPRQACAGLCGCTLTAVWQNDLRRDYCLLGCRSFMCPNSQNSDVGKEMRRGDEQKQCYNQCSEICTSGSQKV